MSEEETVVLSVTKPTYTDNAKPLFHVWYRREGIANYLYVHAKDELEAWQRASKRLEAMDMRKKLSRSK